MAGWHHRLNGLSLSKLRETVKDREAWRAAVRGVAKSRTRLSEWPPPPPRSGIAGLHSSSVFSFLRSLHIVSPVTTPNSLPPPVQEGSHPSHPCQHVLFAGFPMTAILTGVRCISLGLWFALVWWLVMLSVFSCASWPSACPLWKNVYSGLLPMF